MSTPREPCQPESIVDEATNSSDGRVRGGEAGKDGEVPQVSEPDQVKVGSAWKGEPRFRRGA